MRWESTGALCVVSIVTEAFVAHDSLRNWNVSYSCGVLCHYGFKQFLMEIDLR